MIRFLLYKFGQFCVLRLPIQVAYRIAMRISDMHYCLSKQDRAAVTNNLKVILNTQDDVSPLVVEVFRNFGKYLVDFFRMKKTLNEEYIKKNIKVVNLEYVSGAIKKGKGGIFLTAHIGNWELGAALMKYLGYQLVAVALPHKERSVNELFNKQREAWGITIVSLNTAVRRCLETLKANKLIAIVGDRDFTNSGEVLDFLGKKALIPKGAALFSAKTGAPILPAFLIRNLDDTFSLIFEEPIYPPQVHEDVVPEFIILDTMKNYVAVIEKMIRKYPTQWLMFREFWVK